MKNSTFFIEVILRGGEKAEYEVEQLVVYASSPRLKLSANGPYLVFEPCSKTEEEEVSS